MMKMLMLGVVAIAAFGAALGAGWFLNQPAGEGGHADAHGDSHDSHGDSHDVHVDSHADSSVAARGSDSAGDGHDSHGTSESGAGHEGETDLPLPIRPRPISTQEIFEIAMRLQDREKAVAQREEQLDVREDQVNLLREDLKTEQAAVEGLRAEVRSLLQSCQELTTQIQRDQQALAAKQAEIDDLTQSSGAGAAQPVMNLQNIRMIADTIKGLEPQKAADLLKSLSDNGDMDFVIQVYAQLDDRDAAAIGEFIDEQLFTEIITGMRDYERPTAASASNSR